jgi:hypothetical protein
VVYRRSLHAVRTLPNVRSSPRQVVISTHRLGGSGLGEGPKTIRCWRFGLPAKWANGFKGHFIKAPAFLRHAWRTRGGATQVSAVSQELRGKSRVALKA